MRRQKVGKNYHPYNGHNSFEEMIAQFAVDAINFVESKEAEGVIGEDEKGQIIEGLKHMGDWARNNTK